MIPLICVEPSSPVICQFRNRCGFPLFLQYELKELKRRQEEEERIRAEELAVQQAALASLHSPQDGSHRDQ